MLVSPLRALVPLLLSVPLQPASRSALHHVAQPASRSALHHVAMGWADPDWRWGSANGAAHDEAMRVRETLSSPEARKSFLFMVFSGMAPVDTVKMVLALKSQRARNLGYDYRNWESFMNEMAACNFEGEGGEAALCEAIRARLEAPPPVPEEGSAASGINQVAVLAAAALTELKFEERGL